MPKITWCGVAQSPYNDFLLNTINKEFDLQVYYKMGSIKTHPWQLTSADYKQSSISSNILGALRRVFGSDVVVMSGWSFWEHLLIMALPIRATKVYWTDTPNLSQHEWSGVKGKFRRMLVKYTFARCQQVWSTGLPGCIALKQLGCPEQKISSFPFYLDLNRFRKVDQPRLVAASDFRKKNAKDGDIVFLAMGQLAQKKRFHDAIVSLSRQQNKHSVLWIAGTGPEENSLRALAGSLNISDRVVFLGWLDQEKVALAYLASDVFVHPAEFDPFPTVVLDAMTWGKPIIGSNEAGSVKDRVVENVNGYSFDTGDVDTLTRHMQFFIDNPGAVARFGTASRNTAEQYPVEMAVKKISALV